jgi:hypothetical protein
MVWSARPVCDRAVGNGATVFGQVQQPGVGLAAADAPGHSGGELIWLAAAVADG